MKKATKLALKMIKANGEMEDNARTGVTAGEWTDLGSLLTRTCPISRTYAEQCVREALAILDDEGDACGEGAPPVA